MITWVSLNDESGQPVSDSLCAPSGIWTALGYYHRLEELEIKEKFLSKPTRAGGAQSRSPRGAPLGLRSP